MVIKEDWVQVVNVCVYSTAQGATPMVESCKLNFVRINRNILTIETLRILMCVFHMLLTDC